MTLRVRAADAGDAAELADVAAATFPLACPPSVPAADIAAFTAAHLSAPRFADYLTDPQRRVLVICRDGAIVGYAMLIRGIGSDPAVAAAVPQQPAVELSKLYVLAGQHGTGASATLMNAALDWADQAGAECVWLGVNCNNERAQRFYGKQGFSIAGRRTFVIGDGVEHDFVMTRPV